ncbi:MAG: 50S ribosomal protein L24 [candidate division Zixibacteria bacterium]|nr:50S ribosomal protein L24 [candidate division Zixibacteria bacterium]
MRIKKNDTVKIVAGNDRGKIGKVLVVFPEKDRVIVEGVNIIKRHTRPSQRNRKGGIISKEAPVHISNMMYYDSKAGITTKIGSRVLKDGKRVRISKKSGEMIDS